MAARVPALILSLIALPMVLGPVPASPPVAVPSAAADAVEEETAETAETADPQAHPGALALREATALLEALARPPAVIAIREEPPPPPEDDASSLPPVAGAWSPASRAAVPVVRRSWLSIPAVGLELPVVCCYRDWAGRAIPAHGVVTFDARAGANNIYLLGHNPGVFSPLLGVGPGTVVRYWDDRGTLREFLVQARYNVSRTDASPLLASYGAPTLTLQTCLTGTTSTVWVWRASSR